MFTYCCNIRYDIDVVTIYFTDNRIGRAKVGKLMEKIYLVKLSDPPVNKNTSRI